MQTYIALLRGINVSGHNKIKMIALKQLFDKLGYKNVTTYIQSGNVIFQSNTIKTPNIESTIVNEIKNEFGLEISVLVLTKNQLKTIFNSNPFLKRNNVDITKLYVTVLNKKPDVSGLNSINELNKNHDDEFILRNNCIYLRYAKSSARSKLSTNLFENKLKVTATSRNWRTISKLVELSNLHVE